MLRYRRDANYAEKSRHPGFEEGRHDPLLLPLPSEHEGDPRSRRHEPLVSEARAPFGPGSLHDQAHLGDISASKGPLRVRGSLLGYVRWAAAIATTMNSLS
jgi:hypothetical protein